MKNWFSNLPYSDLGPIKLSDIWQSVCPALYKQAITHTLNTFSIALFYSKSFQLQLILFQVRIALLHFLLFLFHSD